MISTHPCLTQTVIPGYNCLVSASSSPVGGARWGNSLLNAGFVGQTKRTKDYRGISESTIHLSNTVTHSHKHTFTAFGGHRLWPTAERLWKTHAGHKLWFEIWNCVFRLLGQMKSSCAVRLCVWLWCWFSCRFIKAFLTRRSEWGKMTASIEGPF